MHNNLCVTGLFVKSPESLLDVNGNQDKGKHVPQNLLEQRLHEEFSGHKRVAWKTRTIQE